MTQDTQQQREEFISNQLTLVQQKIEVAKTILSGSDSLSKELSTELRDVMIDAQHALNLSFPALKNVRRDLFLLKPQS